MKLITVVILVMMLALPEAVQAKAVKTQMVSYKSGDESVNGYLVTPESRGKK